MKLEIFLILSILVLICCCNENSLDELVGKKHPGHGKKFGSSGPLLVLDEVEELPTKIFLTTTSDQRSQLLFVIQQKISQLLIYGLTTI